jgi:hypothetical protein
MPVLMSSPQVGFGGGRATPSAYGTSPKWERKIVSIFQYNNSHLEEEEPVLD